jgi:hypothetical protein
LTVPVMISSVGAQSSVYMIPWSDEMAADPRRPAPGQEPASCNGLLMRMERHGTPTT